MSIETLKKDIVGRIVLPSDEHYDTCRKVHNGSIDKYPAMIVQCADTEDVKKCIRYAQSNDLLLAVRGGGHNAGGLGICDGGLVIDMSPFKQIEIDPAAKTVRVGAGVLLQELDAATSKIGAAVPVGIIGSTGVAGLTLGGGIGYLTRKYGLAIDSLLEADVILANGTQVIVSETEHPDLFWAIRGGGGNFGVVTSFLFRLSPVQTVYAGPMLWELDETEERLQWFHQLMTEAPDDIYGFFAVLTVPPGEPFPAHLHLKKMCGVVWCCTGDPKSAEEYFAPIRAAKPPALDFVGEMPFTAVQGMFDPLYPPGLQWYWKAHYIKDVTDAAAEVHLRFGTTMPTPLSGMHLYPISGAASRVDNKATAWNHRDANYAMVIIGVDPDAANNSKITTWARDYWNEMQPHALGGAYINFMMDEGSERVKATYGSNYNRLSEVKSKYDPQNLFKVNQNIPPVTVK